MAELHTLPGERDIPQGLIARFLYKPDELEHLFSALVEQWRADTVLLSSVDKMAMHPAYQRIIGLGRQVLPLILRELQTQPDHWFWALHAISGEDPVQPGTDFDKAVEAWLEWGRKRDYIA